MGEKPNDLQKIELQKQIFNLNNYINSTISTK